MELNLISFVLTGLATFAFSLSQKTDRCENEITEKNKSGTQNRFEIRESANCHSRRFDCSPHNKTKT